VGLCTYAAFVLGSLVSTLGFRAQRNSQRAPGVPAGQTPMRGYSEYAESVGARVSSSADWQPFAVWLGVLGWSTQGLFEFGLYLPALAWPAFTFLGWLLARVPSPPPPGWSAAVPSRSM